MLPGTDVTFGINGNSVTMVKAKSNNGRPSRGEEAVVLLRGTGHRRMTTDEILKLMRGND